MPRRAAPHGRQPQPPKPAGSRLKIIIVISASWWNRRAAAPLVAPPTPASTAAPAFVRSLSTRSPRRRSPRLPCRSCALALARPRAEHDAPDLPLPSVPPCACGAVLLRHAQRGRNNTLRSHTHAAHDALRMHLPAHSAGPSRVVSQAKPLKAANAEVRPLAARVSVRGGARRRTWWGPIGSEVMTARVSFCGLCCVRTRLLERYPS